MTRIQLMTEYARLLRWFYCNPHDGAVRKKLVAFESEHKNVLDPLWSKWQNEPL